MDFFKFVYIFNHFFYIMIMHLWNCFTCRNLQLKIFRGLVCIRCCCHPRFDDMIQRISTNHTNTTNTCNHMNTHIQLLVLFHPIQHQQQFLVIFPRLNRRVHCSQEIPASRVQRSARIAPSGSPPIFQAYLVRTNPSRKKGIKAQGM